MTSIAPPPSAASRVLTGAALVVPKASDVLAAHLRQKILSGEIEPGQQLPSERDLVAETSLSRASVREALRLLEVEGLIETRRGRNGGSTVRRPTGNELSRSLAVFIRGARLRLNALLEAREAIEPAAAALAARYRTDLELEAIRQSNERMRAVSGDTAAFLAENVEWHLAIVRASRNELFIAIMGSLAPAIHEATEIEPFRRPEIREATIAAHDRVVAAIERRDADAARKYMAGHVKAASEIAVQGAE